MSEPTTTFMSEAMQQFNDHCQTVDLHGVSGSIASVAGAGCQDVSPSCGQRMEQCGLSRHLSAPLDGFYELAQRPASSSAMPQQSALFRIAREQVVSEGKRSTHSSMTDLTAAAAQAQALETLDAIQRLSSAPGSLAMDQQQVHNLQWALLAAQQHNKQQPTSPPEGQWSPTVTGCDTPEWQIVYDPASVNGNSSLGSSRTHSTASTMPFSDVTTMSIPYSTISPSSGLVHATSMPQDLPLQHQHQSQQMLVLTQPPQPPQPMQPQPQIQLQPQLQQQTVYTQVPAGNLVYVPGHYLIVQQDGQPAASGTVQQHHVIETVDPMQMQMQMHAVQHMPRPRVQPKQRVVPRHVPCAVPPPPPPPPPPPSSATLSCRVFVGQLAQDVDEDALARLFSTCGKVLATKIMYNSRTMNKPRSQWRSREFGFVDFSSPAEVQRAITTFHGAVLPTLTKAGSNLLVQPVKPPGAWGAY